VSVTLVVVAPVAERFVGAAGAGELLGGCVTTAVAAEVPLVEPLRLDAMTSNRSVEPRSDAVGP
jgi:hypothetical protein